MSSESRTASVRRSILLAFAQRHLALLIRLGTVVIVSRMVSPSELGVFLIAQAIVTLGLMFADFGVQQYIVSAPGTSRSFQRRALAASLLTSSGAIGVILAGAVFLPSGWLQYEVRTSMVVLVLAAIATPFVSVSKAVMQRDLRYGELFAVNLGGAAAGSGVTIAFASAGFGYMSLVMGAAVETGLSAVLALFFQRPPAPHFSRLRPVLAFGCMMTGIHGIRQAGDSVLPVQVEASLGLSAVGLLGRAQGILMLFDRLLLDTLSHVLLPALSQRRRAGADMAALHSSMVSYLAVMAWPFFGVMALCASQIVRILLGEQWSGAVPLVQILCVGGMFLPFHAFLVPYLIAGGRARPFIAWQAAIQIGRFLLVAAAVFHSLEMVCVALLAERIAFSVAAARLLPAEVWRGDLRILRTCALVSVVSVLGAGVVLDVLPGQVSPMLSITAAAVTAFAIWLLMLGLMRHPLGAEIVSAANVLRGRLRSVGS